MKKLFLLLFVISLKATSFAQSKADTYAVTINFGSVCCGVPDSKPLFDEIILFKKKNKIKTIAYEKTAPLGKEGEYMLGFMLKELNKKQKVLFIDLLKKAVPLLADKKNSSSGNAVMEIDVKKTPKEELGRATIVTEKI